MNIPTIKRIEAICDHMESLGAYTQADEIRRFVAETTKAMWEASNGLTVGWQMTNVPDTEIRERMQAPINAGQEALMTFLRAADAA